MQTYADRNKGQTVKQNKMQDQQVLIETNVPQAKSNLRFSQENQKGSFNKRNIQRRTTILHHDGMRYIIDNGAPVTVVPKLKFIEMTPIHPLQAEYRDVNSNKRLFEGKTLVNNATSG